MPPRRILSLWLRTLAMDRYRLMHGAEDPGRPRVLIADTTHGSRIEAIGTTAAVEGARVGMMLADARAVCPHLATAAYDKVGDLAFLEQLAAWAMRWGPQAALDPPDGLLVDITAVSHLFGSESQLLADVHTAFARRGLTVRAAIAPTVGAAWALAHYGPPGMTLGSDEDATTRLADFPVAALRLEADVITVLHRLGIKRLGQLAKIEEGTGDNGSGRDAIQRRFRNRRSPNLNPLIRLDQLLGRAPESLLPVVPTDLLLAQRRVIEPIRHRELLDRIIVDLANDMARELEERREGARRLELGLWRVDGMVMVRRLELAAATREAAHICRLFAAKLDDVEVGFGIEMMRLHVSWAQPLIPVQGDLDTAADQRGTSLAVCIDRLTARLGSGAVRRAFPFASHLPERAQCWRAPLDPVSRPQERLPGQARPLKLLDRAELIAVLYATPDGYPQRFRWRGQVHDVTRVEGPERIAPEWWREKGSARLRDYYRIEDTAGRRYWIYRAGLIGDGRGGMPEWFLQGLCA
jgi:protein ImuB